MADARKTLELLLTGRDAGASAVLHSASAAAGTFADRTVGSVSRAAASVLNLQNMIIAGSAAMAARSIIQPAIDVETARTQFEILLGDARQASGFVRQLLDFSARTPLQFGDIQSAANALLAAGVAAGGVVPLLQQLGDIAQGDAGKLQSVTHAYIMMRNSGKVTLEQLNVLMNAGIPIVGELGTAMGKTSAQIMAMVSKGQVGFGDLEAAMGAMTGPGGRYEGMMERMSATTAGRLSTMSDNWKLARAEIGEQILPALGEAIDDISASIQELSDSGELKEWGATAAAAVSGLWTVLKGLATFISENRTAIVAAGGSYAALQVWRALGLAIVEVRVALASYTAAASAAAAAAVGRDVVAGTQSLTQYAAAVGKADAAASGLRGSLGLLSGAVRAVGAVGLTAFAGWKIGELVADITGLREEIERIAEAQANAGMSVDENGNDVVAPTTIEQAQEGWLRRQRKELKWPELPMDQALGLKNEEGQDFAAWWRDLQGVQAGQEPERTPERQAEVEASREERARAGRIAAMQEKLEELRKEARIAQQSGDAESAAPGVWQALTGQASAPKEPAGEALAGEALDRAMAAGEGDWAAGLAVVARREALLQTARNQAADKTSREAERIAKEQADATEKLAEMDAEAVYAAAEAKAKAIADAAEAEIKAIGDAADRRATAIALADATVRAAQGALGMDDAGRKDAKRKAEDDAREARKVEHRLEDAAAREAAGRPVTGKGREMLKAFRGEIADDRIAVAEPDVARAALLGAARRRLAADDAEAVAGVDRLAAEDRRDQALADAEAARDSRRLAARERERDELTAKRDQPAPAEGETAPAVVQGVRTPQEPAPAEGETAPAVVQGVRTPQAPAPAEGETAPAVVQGVRTPQAPAPAEGETAPAVVQGVRTPQAPAPAAPDAFASRRSLDDLVEQIARHWNGFPEMRTPDAGGGAGAGSQTADLLRQVVANTDRMARELAKFSCISG
jgi:tape measure domain-containing protein